MSMDNIEKKDDIKTDVQEVKEKPKFDRKAYYKIYSKKYYEMNKNKKSEYMKEKKHCDICNKDINRGSMRLHNESQKHKLKVYESAQK